MKFAEYKENTSQKVLAGSVEITKEECVEVVVIKHFDCVTVDFLCDGELHTYRTRDGEHEGTLYTMYDDGDIKNMSLFKLVKS